LEKAIESRTTPGIFYGVTLYNGGEAECDCPRGIFRKDGEEFCKHVQELVNSLTPFQRCLWQKGNDLKKKLKESVSKNSKKAGAFGVR